MFKDDYKKAMSFPLRESLIQDTAGLLAQPRPAKRQDRWLWGRNVAFAALACLMVTLGVRYAATDGANGFSTGAGSAAPMTAEAAPDADGGLEAYDEAAPADGPAEAAGSSEAYSFYKDSEGVEDNGNKTEAELQVRSSAVPQCADVTIALADVKQLAEMGEALDWASLERLGVSEEGEIPVEGGVYVLHVAGTDPKDLTEVTLYLWESPEISVDLRRGDVEFFLSEYTPEE